MIDPLHLHDLEQRLNWARGNAFSAACRALFVYIEQTVSRGNPALATLDADRKTKWKDWKPSAQFLSPASWQFPDDPSDCVSLAWNLFRTIGEAGDGAPMFLLQMYGERDPEGNRYAFVLAWLPYLQDADRLILAHELPDTSFGRERQQKFGILDSPALIEQDLQRPPGLLGSAVVFADLDDFKTLNSQFTETVVDRALLPLVHQVFQGCVQSIGFGYAMGGDEFAFFLPNVSAAMALAFAHEIRTRVQALTFRGEMCSVCVTASIGLAYTARDSCADLLQSANEAKNRAKAAGKNCVVQATDPALNTTVEARI